MLIWYLLYVTKCQIDPSYPTRGILPNVEDRIIRILFQGMISAHDPPIALSSVDK